MALPIIANTNTFKAWLDQTNNTATILNANAIVTGVDAEGVFAVKKASGTSISLANGVAVNSSAVLISSNTSIAANLSVSSAANTFAVASNNFTVSPAQGTRFDTATTVNAAFGILGVTTATANVGVTGDLSVTGNTLLTGATTANGPITTRQVIFAASGATSNVQLDAANYNNYDTNVANVSVLSWIPTVNCTISGIAAPNNSVLGSTGARVLHIQNLSPTYYVTLQHANTNSTDVNRFETAGGVSVDVPPAGSLSLLYSKHTARWRVLAPQLAPTGTQTFSDMVLTGNLSVYGSATVNANAAFGTTLYVDKTNLRVGIGKNNPAYQLETTGNTYIGGWLITPSANITALNSTGNVSLIGGNFLVSTTNTVFVANTITVNGAATSTIRSLSGNTITATQTLSTANLTVSGHASLATVAISGNTNFFGGAIIANTSGNTLFVANTIIANGTPNSYIRTLQAATIYSDGGVNAVSLGISGNAAFANITVTSNATFANVSVTANASLANATFTAVVKPSGTEARFVLPVGANYYAT